jgi:hypothetical protein
MKYAIAAGSGAVICIPSYIKIGSGIQRFKGGFIDTQTAWSSHKPTFISRHSLFCFFLSKEVKQYYK